jgi:hypothetical protein
MHQPDHTPTDDIAKQPYRGPSVAAAAAGEGYIAHFLYAGIGMTLGFFTTYVFHGHSQSGVTKLRETAGRLATNESRFMRGWGRFLNSLFGHGEGFQLTPEILDKVRDEHQHGFGLWFLNHTVGVFPGARQWINNFSDRAYVSVTAGGLLSAFGFFVMPWLVAHKGYARGREGKRQFETAKDEIWDLRAENDQLRHRNLDLKTQLNDIQTVNPEQNKLRIAPDEPPVVHDDGTAQMPLTQAPDAQDQSKQETKDSPVAPTAPEIKSPTVTDPITGKVSHVSAVDKETPTDPIAQKTSHVESAAKTGRAKDWKDAVAARDAEQSHPALVS